MYESHRISRFKNPAPFKTTGFLIFITVLTSCKSPAKQPLSIYFGNNSSTLNTPAKHLLDSIANEMQGDTKALKLASTFKDLCDECGAKNFDRNKRIAEYLIFKGVNAERIFCSTGVDNQWDKIDLAIIFDSSEIAQLLTPMPLPAITHQNFRSKVKSLFYDIDLNQNVDELLSTLKNKGTLQRITDQQNLNSTIDYGADAWYVTYSFSLKTAPYAEPRVDSAIIKLQTIESPSIREVKRVDIDFRFPDKTSAQQFYENVYSIFKTQASFEHQEIDSSTGTNFFILADSKPGTKGGTTMETSIRTSAQKHSVHVLLKVNPSAWAPR